MRYWEGEFVPCLICKSYIDKFREDFMPVQHGCICGNCILREAIKHDSSINPLPDHMRAEVEPYIQYREGIAIGKFILEVEEQRSANG